MALFQFKWLRQFIRRHMTPIPEASAYTWKNRISLLYMLIAWNGFGFVCYMMYKGKSDWAKDYKDPEYMKLTPGNFSNKSYVLKSTVLYKILAQQWSQTLGIKQAKVYRIKGFSVEQYEINNDTPEEEDTSKIQDAGC